MQMRDDIFGIVENEESMIDAGKAQYAYIMSTMASMGFPAAKVYLLLENEETIGKPITTFEQAMDRMLETPNGYSHAFFPHDGVGALLKSNNCRICD